MSEARGFWKGGDLWWRIGAEEISDRELRSWVHHNMTGINRHVGKCILKLRAEAVSLRRDFGKGERLKGGRGARHIHHPPQPRLHAGTEAAAEGP